MNGRTGSRAPVLTGLNRYYLAAFLALLACSTFTGAAAGSSRQMLPALVVQRGATLYAIAADGSRRVRLTRLPRGSQPALSPDGSTVAFDRRGGIATKRLDGSHARMVTRGGYSPAWAPDGETLYFVRYHPDGFGSYCGSIFSVAASGGSVRRVTNSKPSGHSHENPAVSPDGNAIAFSDWNYCQGGTASPRLRVVDTNGRRTRDLARLRRNGYYPDPEHSTPAWSPGGTRIAYRFNADLAVAYRDGSGERRIIPGGGFLIYEPPVWSPDGRWIAFTRYTHYAGTYAVIVAHPDGTGRHRIARSGGVYFLAGWVSLWPK